MIAWLKRLWDDFNNHRLNKKTEAERALLCAHVPDHRLEAVMAAHKEATENGTLKTRPMREFLDELDLKSSPKRNAFARGVAHSRAKEKAAEAIRVVDQRRSLEVRQSLGRSIRHDSVSNDVVIVDMTSPLSPIYQQTESRSRNDDCSPTTSSSSSHGDSSSSYDSGSSSSSSYD